MIFQKKSQAAMEFLMTYGWAILAVLITIAALAYFGVLSPAKLLPDSCTFFPGLACNDVVVSAIDHSIIMQVRNGIGSNLIVYSVSENTAGCSSARVKGSDLSYSPNGVSITDGETADIMLLGCNSIGGSGSKYKSDISMSYSVAQAGITHTRVGSISSLVSESSGASPSVFIDAFRQGENGYSSSQDTIINGALPVSSFATSSTLQFRKPGTFAQVSFLSFYDISIIPDTATITSAAMQLTVTSSTAGNIAGLYKLTTAGAIIPGATWNTKDGSNPWQGGGAFSSLDYDPTVLSTTAVPDSTSSKFNVSIPASYMQGQLASNSIRFVFLNEGNPDTLKNFASNDNLVITNRPKLFISYNP